LQKAVPLVAGWLFDFYIYSSTAFLTVQSLPAFQRLYHDIALYLFKTNTMKYIALAVIIASLPFAVSAQFGGLANKVKSKVNQRTDQRVSEAIDKGLDKAEGKSSGGNTATTASTTSSSQTTVTEEPALKSTAKFDFIPGAQIVYYENFDQEALGELPTGWNTNGSGEVTTLDKFPGKWLRVHAPFTYLTANQKELGENYTIEFDIILQLKNNGWMYPEVSFGLFSSGTESNSTNDFLRDYDKYGSVTALLSPGEYKHTKIRIKSYADNKSYFSGEFKPLGELEQWYGKPVHMAIQVQKERFRMWVNEVKAFDLPKAVPMNYVMNQLQIRVHHTNYNDSQYGIYISNIKMAKGLPDTRHKLIDEGKFSTTAILFDVNAASLKPASYGIIKEVAGILKEHNNLRIKITGYTDSDGNDKDNLLLSQQRAAAVKTALVSEYGIDESRMETDGKGESESVGDNKTKEGKAANRRIDMQVLK
jgi:OOP family OmpA-OmpF porin